MMTFKLVIEGSIEYNYMNTPRKNHNLNYMLIKIKISELNVQIERLEKYQGGKTKRCIRKNFKRYEIN